METYKVTVEDCGTICWYNQNDQLHRLDGPAIEYPDGYKAWYINGKRHHLDGPAIEYPDGYKAWYINGKRHHLDGPAIEYPDGSKEWYIEGKKHTEEEFINRNKKEMTVAEIEKALGYSIKIVKG